MTELSFLIDLLLNHKLPKATREVVKARLNEIQLQAVSMPSPVPAQRSFSIQPMSQMPQTAATNPVPVEGIAQTAAAQAALVHRQQMISKAMRDGLSGDGAVKCHATPPGPGR